MEWRRQSEVIRERVVRHNRLMKLIKNYTRNEQESQKLQRIKINTMMEINIRYLRSDHNRYYKFPKRQLSDESDEDDNHEQDPLLFQKQNIVYDLRSQNLLSPMKSLSQKILSLDNSRRVASLEIERNSQQRERILRLHVKGKNNQSSKKLTRKNSLVEKMRKDRSRLKLPELKTQKNYQNLKTEGRGNQEDHQIHSVIGRKLATESSEGNFKMKGVEKYLKKVQVHQKQNQIKNNYRKKVFLPDKNN